MSGERPSVTNESIEPLNKSSEHSDSSAKFVGQLFEQSQAKDKSPATPNPIKPIVLADGTGLYPYGENGKLYVKPDGTKIIETLDSKGNTIQQFSFGISQGPTRIIYKDQPITLERVKTHDGGRADSWLKDGKLYQTDFYNKQGKKIIIDKHLPNGDIEQTYPDSPGAFKIIHPDGSIYEKIVTNSGSRTRMLDKDGKELPPMPPAAGAVPKSLPEIKITPNTKEEALSSGVKSTIAQINPTTELLAFPPADTILSPHSTDKQSAPSAEEGEQALAISTDLSSNNPSDISADIAETKIQNNERIIIDYKITDDDLSQLIDSSKTNNIKAITITPEADLTGVTQKGIALLSQLDKLEELSINNDSLDDSWLIGIQNMDQLKTLRLSGKDISGLGLAHLKNLKGLISLDLSASDISDKDLFYISELNNLNSLNLSHTLITNEGLESVKKLSNLSSLNLNNTEIDDVGLWHLRNLDKIQTLDINNTKVTDRGFPNLANLPNLKSLFYDHKIYEDKKLKELIIPDITAG